MEKPNDEVISEHTQISIVPMAAEPSRKEDPLEHLVAHLYSYWILIIVTTNFYSSNWITKASKPGWDQNLLVQKKKAARYGHVARN